MNQILRRQQRIQESLQENFKFSHEANFQVLTSSSDIGVQRNFGRIGSRFASKTIISELKKLSSIKNLKLQVEEVSSQSYEKENFDSSQENEALKIFSFLNKRKSTIHLGGGHDHVYPLLKALEKKYKKLFIINIDPHLDCRKESLNHSGTPFIQFLNESTSDSRLLQYGIKNYANTSSNFNSIRNLEQITILPEHASLSTNYLWQNFAKDLEDSFFVISLDCDVLENFPAVSAPAHQGQSFQEIRNFILDSYESFPNIALGIYELNPLYDDLANSSSRKMASLIHDIMDTCLNA